MTPQSEKRFLEWLATEKQEAEHGTQSIEEFGSFHDGVAFGRAIALRDVWEYFTGPVDQPSRDKDTV